MYDDYSGLAALGKMVNDTLPVENIIKTVSSVPDVSAAMRSISLSEAAIRRMEFNTRRIIDAGTIGQVIIHKAAIERIVDRAGFVDTINMQSRMMQNLGNAISQIQVISKNVGSIADQCSGITAALEAFGKRMSYIEEYGLSTSKFTTALERALYEVSVKDTQWMIDPDELLRRTTENYEAETDEEKRIIESVSAVDSPAVKPGIINASYILKQILLFLISTIIGGLIQIQMENVIKNDVPQSVYINNYYFNQINETLTIEGYNISLIDNLGYRIVNTDITVRLKPDCSSRVIGHLKRGAVVLAIRKYKKWVEITWTDVEGNSYTGFIQNYKLTRLGKRK